MTTLYPLQLQLDRREIASRTVVFSASTTDPVRAVEKVGEKDVEFWDAIVEWDFSRFLKNPLVTWAHDYDVLPLGTAQWIEFNQDTGLSTAIKFATERANPFAEQVWRAMEEGIVRSVSVGFDSEILSTEERDGKIFRTVKASLSEIAVLPLGADLNAIARSSKRAMVSVGPQEETEEELRKKISEAAKALASARRPKLDSSDDDDLRLDVGSRLERAKIERTPVGGIKIPARIARTGVLTYRKLGQEPRREFRPPEEVFKPEALASFEGAPVIDFTDHVALVTTEDFRKKTIGHTANVRMDGQYVVADLFINDATAIEMIDRGERLDISAGYVARKHDFTPGSFGGEEYDLIQRDIVGNHVALCPPNRGRSGPEVSLRLDSDAHWSALFEEPEKEKTMKLIKLDGKDFEFGSEAHISKIEELHKAELSAVKAESDSLRAKFDAAEAEKKSREQEKEERAKREAEEEEERKKRFKARSKRALRAARIMEEEDEEKLDALLDKEDREIMIAAIKHLDPKFDKLDETDDYLRARFDALEVPAGRATGVAGVVTSIEQARLDAAEDDPVEKARKEMCERHQNAWKKQA